MARRAVVPRQGGSQLATFTEAPLHRPSPTEMGFASTFRIGLLMILVFVGVFGAWAGLAPLESAAIAMGEVAVEGDRRTIDHLEGGIVGQILVRDGAIVKAGDPLVLLDDTQARASVGVLTTRLVYATALEARLTADRDRLDSLVVSPWLAAQAAGDPEIAKVVEVQRTILVSRAETMASQLAILDNRKEQFGEEIIGLEAEVSAIDQELVHIRAELGDVTRLVRQNLAPRSRLYSLQRQEAEILGRRGRIIAQIARARQSVAEADLRAANMTTEAVEQAIREMRDVQGEIADLHERLAAARDVLARTAIRAPVDGIVVNTQVHTANSVIRPGEALMQIVPVGEGRVIRARVDPIDIDVIRSGLRATVRLSAFSARTTPELFGTVELVSADRLIDQQTGLSYYDARIRLDDNELAKVGGIELSPGMPVEVMITTGQTTLLRYLVQPFTDLMRRGITES